MYFNQPLLDEVIRLNHYLQYFYEYSSFLAGLLCALIAAAIWRG